MAGTNRLDFDPTELNYLHGYVDGIKAEATSTAYIGSVINYAHAIMAPKLDAWIDLIAAANPESFHHVYEWPDRFGSKANIGNPTARLWKHTLKGHGSSKVASFEFKASIKPSPVNPILTTPGPNGETVKEGIHIFYWKAMAMEYGMQIVVEPKLAQYLAFVGSANSGTKQKDARSNKGGLIFSRGPITFTAGGGKTTGRFTNAFRFWWSQMSSDVFDKEVAPTLSKDLVKGGVVGNFKSNSKIFAINNNSGYAAGRAEAIKKLRKNEKDYTIGAATRMRFSR